MDDVDAAVYIDLMQFGFDFADFGGERDQNSVSLYLQQAHVKKINVCKQFNLNTQQSKKVILLTLKVVNKSEREMILSCNLFSIYSMQKCQNKKNINKQKIQK